jgi:hypothetical protein
MQGGGCMNREKIEIRSITQEQIIIPNSCGRNVVAPVIKGWRENNVFTLLDVKNLNKRGIELKNKIMLLLER